MIYYLVRSRADEILRTLTNIQDLDHGSMAHQAWMCTTRGTEARLRGAREIIETEAGRKLFSLADTKSKDALDQTVAEAVASQVERTMARDDWLQSPTSSGRPVEDVDAFLYHKAAQKYSREHSSVTE